MSPKNKPSQCYEIIKTTEFVVVPAEFLPSLSTHMNVFFFSYFICIWLVTRREHI